MVDITIVEKALKLLQDFDLFQNEIKQLIDQISQQYPNYKEALTEAFEVEDIETIQNILEKVKCDLMSQESEDAMIQEQEGTVTTTIQIGDQKISVQFVLPKKKGIAG